jgi:hypothetical protein
MNFAFRIDSYSKLEFKIFASTVDFSLEFIIQHTFTKMYANLNYFTFNSILFRDHFTNSIHSKSIFAIVEMKTNRN